MRAVTKSEALEGLRVMMTCRPLARPFRHSESIREKSNHGWPEQEMLVSCALYSCSVVEIHACRAHGFALCSDRPATFCLFLDCSHLLTLYLACCLCDS